ncbi:Beta-lactamase class A-like and penicillin binding proteins (PBPs) superfamily [Amycolatopsis camponoti]|uniref:Beta-lactamase class A-like and penicillin binding proteins (PBPs) superfamily n=1 Tax=Amycolatopsis camponoti TaxID=2606593 RepID=A0A6I8LQP4_9PSEU|nr:serine hydrolase [Amycolatopsis camponoti]VVJ20144.1 Beta-lactamase class A-like and penicillin binding proteins (PBPs) superfamily [Amycolatopsis camponoti]
MKTAIAGVLAVLAPLVAPVAQAAEVPTATHQLEWVVDATGRVPVSDAEVREHVAEALLTAAGGTAGVNGAFARLGPIEVKRIVTEAPDHVAAAVHGPADDYLLDLHVDPAGLIDGLAATPDDPVPASWPEVDAQLAALGARVSFGASEILPDGRCQVVHGVRDDVQRPLGSAFKLYVLGALGKAVAEHKASWSEQLAIRDDWKSLPSGVLQNEPAGTRLPLSAYADKMISISDNTATDHLIHRLGRDAVQRQVIAFGNQRPSANIPFLTTKALFELKATQYPARADAYLALPRWARPAAVAGLERLPLTGLQGWQAPEKIDDIEWFGSPGDICRAFSGLRKENQPEIGHALSLNDGGLGLDRAKFPEVWFKGGSEPGVLTLNYLARTADGRSLVTSVMVSDPVAPLDENHVAARGIAVAKGAVALLAATLRP